MTSATTTPRKLFGTDGIRGPFGRFPLDEATVAALGAHLAAALGGEGAEPVVVLGGDTRDSTPTLCSWLAAGLAAGGGRVRYAGIVPTPAVARLTPRLGAACGIAVSASHNPHPDNGIKLVDGAGFKWEPQREAALEQRLLARPDAGPRPRDGELRGEEGLAAAYLSELAATLPGPRSLAGLEVVLDAGHGAASAFAGPLFSELGASVTLLHAEPDGRNINRGCGSTRPEVAAAEVRHRGAHLGVCFDGDADRAILVDESGRVHDGDAILYLWARSLAREGHLVPPSIVATSMSNLGLERALERDGITVERCGVGDREVVATLRRQGLSLGGEQSGHIVHLGLATTGDGLLTALQMAYLVLRRGRPLSELLEGFRRFPQVLRNVPVARKEDFATLPAVAAVARRVEDDLGDDGRLLLRYSGTEPVARIMIEGRDQKKIEALAAELTTAVEEALG